MPGLFLRLCAGPAGSAGRNMNMKKVKVLKTSAVSLKVADKGILYEGADENEKNNKNTERTG
jgi:hypothetical protein